MHCLIIVPSGRCFVESLVDYIDRNMRSIFYRSVAMIESRVHRHTLPLCHFAPTHTVERVTAPTKHAVTATAPEGYTESQPPPHAPQKINTHTHTHIRSRQNHDEKSHHLMNTHIIFHKTVSQNRFTKCFSKSLHEKLLVKQDARGDY